MTWKLNSDIGDVLFPAVKLVNLKIFAYSHILEIFNEAGDFLCFFSRKKHVRHTFEGIFKYTFLSILLCFKGNLNAEL